MIKNDANEDVTNKLNISYVNGTIKINPASLTVETASASKVYDGTALTKTDGYTFTGLVNGETATLNCTGSQTTVGSSANTYTISWGSAKSSNYTVTSETLGKLVVTSKSINPDDEITGITVNNPEDHVYDADEHKEVLTVTDTKVKDAQGNDTVLTEGTDYEVSYFRGKEATDDFTNVGTITITVTGKGNYSGSFSRTYQITPKEATITADNHGKVFGQEDPTLSVTKSGFIEGEKDKITYKTLARATGEDVGEYAIEVNGETSQGNYTVTYVAGKFTITAKSIVPDTPETPEGQKTGITVTEPKDSAYDATEHKETLTVIDTNTGKILAEGTDYEVTYSRETEVTEDFKNVGEITITVTGKGNYKGSFSKNYKITQAEVTVTANENGKTYGTTDPELTAKVTGTYGNDTVKYTVTRAEGENVGTYDITPTGEASQGNYTVTYANGTFEITAQSINPGTDPENPDSAYNGVEVGNLEDVVYNGEPQEQKPAVIDKEGTALVENTDYTISFSEDTTNAGQVTVTITGIGNYTGEVTRTYNITKRNVKLTSEDASKVYDGTPLTAEELAVEGDGFVEGEASAQVTGTITNVGETDNTIEITYGEHYKADNYNVETVEGKLTVTAKSITPDTPDTPEEDKTGIEVSTLDDVKYNGASQQQKPEINDTKTGKTLVEGTDYEVTYSEDTTNAGQVTVTITGIGNYTGEYTVTYNILKRDVTFTSPSASKTYDGSALTSTEIAISGEGFVEGEGASFNVTGTATEVGEVDNTFDYAMNEGTNADNYNVTVVNGKLTITAAPVVPSNDDTTPTTPVVPATTPTRRTTPVTPAQPEVTPTETPEATVEPTATPEATATPEVIDDDETPKVAPKGNWALINLIAAMLSVLLGVIAILAKHKDEEDEEDETEDENVSTRHRRWKIVSAIDAIVAVVAFILTEDITQKMVMVDKWTILMVVIAVVGVVSMYFARKWHEEDEETSEDAQ